jgi:hypothetical protein
MMVLFASLLDEHLSSPVERGSHNMPLVKSFNWRSKFVVAIIEMLSMGTRNICRTKIRGLRRSRELHGSTSGVEEVFERLRIHRTQSLKCALKYFFIYIEHRLSTTTRTPPLGQRQSSIQRK